MSRERIPKEEWEPGPWHEEPDEAHWRYRDQFCFMLRGPFGSWNGYVAVLPGHPFWGKHQSECILNCEPRFIELPTGNTSLDVSWRRMLESGRVNRETYDCHHHLGYLIEVHGGITWASYANEIIRHPDADDLTWCIGFDCGHAWDVAPGMDAVMREMRKQHPEYGLSPMSELRIPDSVYRDFAYVQKQVNNLAEQVIGFGLPLYKSAKVEEQ